MGLAYSIALPAPRKPITENRDQALDGVDQSADAGGHTLNAVGGTVDAGNRAVEYGDEIISPRGSEVFFRRVLVRRRLFFVRAPKPYRLFVNGLGRIAVALVPLGDRAAALANPVRQLIESEALPQSGNQSLYLLLGRVVGFPSHQREITGLLPDRQTSTCTAYAGNSPDKIWQILAIVLQSSTYSVHSPLIQQHSGESGHMDEYGRIRVGVRGAAIVVDKSAPTIYRWRRDNVRRGSMEFASVEAGTSCGPWRSPMFDLERLQRFVQEAGNDTEPTPPDPSAAASGEAA